MKKILYTIISTFFCIIINSQTNTYPTGLYMSFDDVINKSPSNNVNLLVEKRTKGDIKMIGGNDYKISSFDNNKKQNKYIKRELLAYSDGTNLYINGFKYEIQFWFNKIESENNKYFLIFAGLPSNYARYNLDSKNISFMFGGLISGFGAAKRALIRLPYLIEKETQNVTLISEKNMANFLQDDSVLLEQFNKETDKKNVELLMRYLKNWIEKSE